MAGGIGNVATLPEYRRRGFATKLLGRAIQFMRKKKYSLSILFTGIPHFYRRLKWEIASPDYKYLIPVSEISKVSRAPATFYPQIFERRDLPTVMRMYELTNRERTLSVLRSKRCWRAQLSHGLDEDPGGFIVIKRQGHARAYARCTKSREALEVIESGYFPNSPDAQSACKALLTNLGGHALETGHEQILVNAPPDHLLVKQLLERRGTNRSRVLGSLMVRIIDLKELAERVLPEFENRIFNTRFSGKIEIRTEEDWVVLKIKRGEVSKVADRGQNIYRTSHRVLAQHLTGYLSPREALKRGLARANPSVGKIVDLLFRNRVPSYMWKPDRF
jgi:predicted acetyltransferase